MTRSFFAAAACFALSLVQDAGPDRLVTTAGEETRGEITGIGPDGALSVKTGKGSRTIPLDDIRRLLFEDKPQISLEKTGDKLRPRFGGTMTGTVVSIDAGRVELKCSHGTYSIRREEVASISFGEAPEAPKEIKEDQDLVLLARDPGKPEAPAAVTGKVESLDAESVRVAGVEHPRARIREIRFRPGTAREPAVGLFARVLMKNGDGLIGTLRKVEPGRVLLFTHYAGVATLEKSAIHSIALVPLARVQSGHILVCEPGGVTEIDRDGRKVWSYGEGAVGCTSARKLPGGNVIVANANRNLVFEVRPTGVAGGQVVWSLDEVTYPFDAQRLENGRVLVAEYGASRIAEYDLRDRSVKWSVSIPGGPTAVERLDDGSTLVSVNQGAALEVDAKGNTRTQYSFAGGLNEYRATRTAEGTTLIADQRGTQVVEVDRKRAVLWKFETPQPRLAVRLDDGHTLILKRNGEIIEVDLQGQTLRTFGRFSNAACISVY